MGKRYFMKLYCHKVALYYYTNPGSQAGIHFSDMFIFSHLILHSSCTYIKFKTCTMQVVHEVMYIRSSEERQQIMRACHVEPTSGHMGMKRTIHRITERFFWKGVTKDVEHMVRTVYVSLTYSCSRIAILVCRLKLYHCEMAQHQDLLRAWSLFSLKHCSFSDLHM